MKINKIKEKGQWTTYYTSKSFGNQTACLFFSKMGEEGDEDIFNIGLAIGKNRKQTFKWWFQESSFMRTGKTRASEDRVTGKNGIAPLIWAYRSMTEIEKYIRDITPIHKKAAIRIRGSNLKRHHVYERYLTKIGYKVINKSLIKIM